MVHPEAGALSSINSFLNSDALLVALLGAAAAAVFGAIVAWYQRRRRISWRVLYDAPVNQGQFGPDDPNIWKISVEGQEIDNGSIVILEVLNPGVTVEESDWLRNLSFTFDRRTVKHFKVRDSDELHDRIHRRDALLPDAPSTIVLPKLQINRGVRFKLTILLAGDGNRVKANHPKTTLHDGRVVHVTGRPLRWRIATAAVVSAAVVGAYVGVRVANVATSIAPSCATGTLTIAGSTAFGPIAKDVADTYEHYCPGATITVQAVGSGNGLNELRADTADIAMSDGQASGTNGLPARPVGVVVFAVVANAGVRQGTQGLNTLALQSIFSATPYGGYVAVGRDQGSGTREAFELNVLGAQQTTFPADRPCYSANGVPVTHGACTEDTTMDLLAYVNRTPNAIGYAEANALPYFPNVSVVPINGVAPSRDAALNGTYSFVAPEYLYTSSRPSVLATDFLGFLAGDTGASRLRDPYFIGCSDLAGTKLGAEYPC